VSVQPTLSRGGATVAFHELSRLVWSSSVHRTESVSAIVQAWLVAVSSIPSDQSHNAARNTGCETVTTFGYNVNDVRSSGSELTTSMLRNQRTQTLILDLINFVTLKT